MARTDEFKSLTKEEQLEMMRDYGGIGNPNSAFSIEERYPCIADDEEIMKKEVFSEKVSDRTTGESGRRECGKTGFDNSVSSRSGATAESCFSS